MKLVRGIVEGIIVAKVIQELTKPENQRKIKDGLGKLAKAAHR